MALAIAGLPWLAGILGGLFTSLVTFLTTYLTKKLALVVAAIALLVSLTSAFLLAINALITGLITVVPSNLTALVGQILPNNVDTCFSALMATYVLRWAYEWNVKIVQMKLF